MKAKTQSPLEVPRIETFDDVFDALYSDDPGKATAMKLRSDALMIVRACVSAWSGTQAQKAKRLQITQPRLNLLMRSSDLERFRLDDLVALSVRAGAAPALSFRGPASAVKAAGPAKKTAAANAKARHAPA